jgi:hypothetical protein
MYKYFDLWLIIFLYIQECIKENAYLFFIGKNNCSQRNANTKLVILILDAKNIQFYIQNFYFESIMENQLKYHGSVKFTIQVMD